MQASECVEAGIAKNQNVVNQWRLELENIELVEFSGRGFEKRSAGRSTFRWRLTVDLPDDIRRRGGGAQTEAEWSLMLEETCRAILALSNPKRFYPKELANAISTSGQNISARLTRLEALGAVERVEHRTTERGQPWLWSVTEAGVRHLLEARQARGT